MFSKDSTASPFSMEAQFNMYALLVSATLQKATELARLNLTLSRDAIRESADAQKRLLAAADASQYTALSALLARESVERSLGYARDVVAIVTRTHLSSPPAGKAEGASADSKAA